MPDLNEILLFASSVFMGFFALMNPIGNTPIFLSLTENYDNATKQKIALKSTVTAFLIILLFTLIGNYIFKVFHITLPAFRITGGLLIVSIGFNLLRNNQSKTHGHSENVDRSDYTDTDIAISPLAIPILAGPGTLSTAMNFATVYKTWKHVLFIVMIAAAVCGLTYLSFISGQRLIKFLGRDITNVISKLMGLIIAIIGVQMIISGSTTVLGAIMQGGRQ